MRDGALRDFLDSMPAELTHGEALGRGQGVTVAIVDSGVEASHPELGAPVTKSVEVRLSGRGTAVVPCEPRDDAGHGTACASIVGQLAPECEIWSVRALGPQCRGDQRGLLAALAWSIDSGADVINLSLGTRDAMFAEPLRTLVAKAYRAGILVVAAANNVPGVRSYPAVFTSLVCVDAAYIKDPETFHFRFGELAELVGPGVYVDAAWPGGGRKLVTGTSFACPHISGHIARILSSNPGIKPFQVRSVLFSMGQRFAERARANVTPAPEADTERSAQ